MLKKVMQGIIVLCILSLSFTTFAAPDTIGTYDQGTTTGLIVVSNPPSVPYSTTYEKNYILSGWGQEGVNICLYLYSPAENVYKKLIINGNSVEWQIGASGLFMQPVTLSKGENKIAIRAEDGYGNSQVIQMDINLLSQSLLDKLLRAF